MWTLLKTAYVESSPYYSRIKHRKLLYLQSVTMDVAPVVAEKPAVVEKELKPEAVVKPKLITLPPVPPPNPRLRLIPFFHVLQSKILAYYSPIICVSDTSNQYLYQLVRLTLSQKRLMSKLIRIRMGYVLYVCVHPYVLILVADVCMIHFSYWQWLWLKNQKLLSKKRNP